MKVDTKNTEINITFSQDEALVLFEWLSKFNEKEDYDFEDQAEERVLWDIEALLEKALCVVMTKNYKSLLMKARKNVRDILSET